MRGTLGKVIHTAQALREWPDPTVSATSYLSNSNLARRKPEVPAALLAFNLGVESGQILLFGVIIATVGVITAIVATVRFAVGVHP